MVYAWTDSHDYTKGANDINVCGAKYPENRLTIPIDVIVPHSDKSITIGFGSTLDNDPFENAFGVSNLQIYMK